MVVKRHSKAGWRMGLRQQTGQKRATSSSSSSFSLGIPSIGRSIGRSKERSKERRKGRSKERREHTPASQGVAAALELMTKAARKGARWRDSKEGGAMSSVRWNEAKPASGGYASGWGGTCCMSWSNPTLSLVIPARISSTALTTILIQ